MVHRALRIRIGLDNITALERDLRDFELSDDEWNVLTGIKEFLEPFANVTKNIEGSLYPTLSMVIPLYNALIDHIEDWVDDAQDDDRESDAVEGEFERKCPETKAGALAAKQICQGITTEILKSTLYVLSLIQD